MPITVNNHMVSRGLRDIIIKVFKYYQLDCTDLVFRGFIRSFDQIVEEASETIVLNSINLVQSTIV